MARQTRRLEAHGEEYKLPQLSKISALNMFITGEAKEYFDIWEADRDATDPATSYEELLSNIED